MEYEIEDEQVLFDDSTNPSLKPKRQSVHLEPPAPPQKPKRKQDAVLIPEEEQQAA
jgi:hypothetical protein